MFETINQCEYVNVINMFVANKHMCPDMMINYGIQHYGTFMELLWIGKLDWFWRH